MIKKSRICGLALGALAIIYPLTSFVIYEVKTISEALILVGKEANNDYFAILQIDKIELKEELFALDSEQNDLNSNVLIHEASTFPSTENSNLILAAHSGYGQNAYFRNLYKLDVGDEIKLYYNGYLWIYEIQEIEYQAKTGKLYLKENNTSQITLITCTKDDSTTQTLYYGILKTREKL